MYEKIQQTMKNEVDTNAVALSLLRCGRFRDAEVYFDESLEKNADDSVALLGKLGVQLKHTILVDYVLGVSEDSCMNLISPDNLIKSSDLISRLLKGLTDEALCRFVNALDLFLSILMTEGFAKPTKFAELCRFIPSNHPSDEQYIHPFSFIRALPNLSKSLKVGAIDDLAVVMYERLRSKEDKKAFAVAAATFFKGAKAQMSTYRWYTKLSAIEGVELKYLVDGANALVELGMTKESLTFYREILKREPDNADAKLGLLLSELTVHINTRNIDALEGYEDRLDEFLNTLNNRASTILKRLVDHLKPIVSDVWTAKGSFRLLDLVLNRLYATNKGTYAKACTDIAKSCLQNGNFEVAKLFVENAIPNIGDDTHEQHFLLLLIALKCKDEKALLESMEFSKSHEAYKALLYSVRDNAQLLKKYTELADKIQKQQKIKQDALALMLALDAESKASGVVLHRTKNNFRISCFWIWLFAIIGIPLTFLLVPFAFTRSFWFTLIPVGLCILQFYLVHVMSKNVSETYQKSSKRNEILDVCHKGVNSAGRALFVCVILFVVLGVTSCNEAFYKYGNEGFNLSLKYSAIVEEHAGEEEIVGLRIEQLTFQDKDEIFVPAKIKGYSVEEIAPWVYNNLDKITFEIDEDITLISSLYSDVPSEVEYCVLIHESAKYVDVKALCELGVDRIYFEGDRTAWNKVVSENADCEVYFFSEQEAMTSWHYNIFGEVTEW